MSEQRQPDRVTEPRIFNQRPLTSVLKGEEVTPEMFMAEARSRFLNDADFRARAERAKQFAESLVRDQHLEYSPEIIIDISIGMGLLMADANIEMVMNG